jgi:hypothetical protein
MAFDLVDALSNAAAFRLVNLTSSESPAENGNKNMGLTLEPEKCLNVDSLFDL